MTKLNYTFKTLIRGKGSNVIKTISLTLGLAISVILFARIAFELSYDSHYQEVDRLHVIESIYHINGEKTEPHFIIFGAVPGGIVENLTDGVESATVVRTMGADQPFYYEEFRLQPHIIVSDTLYFQTMGIHVLSGDPRELANPDVLFVSREFARNTFGDESPVGKTLSLNKEISMTVKGVYEDIPENSTLRHDVVISLGSLIKYNWGRISWDRGDMYRGYVRLRPGVDPEQVNKRMNVIAHQHYPFEPESGIAVEYQLTPIKSVYTNNKEVRQMNLLLFMLGFSLLFVAAMNYVLISISSLYKRAKAVGVHKCSGATGGDIFLMFLQETGILLGVSVALAFALLFTFRESIEDLIGVSMYGLFNWDTSWLPVCVMLLLFLFAGVIPGKIFSAIPVTQVFRRYTETKSGWKRPLLFVEFAGVAFIFGLMCMIMLQYQQIMNKDLGYKPDPIATAYHQFSDAETGRSLLKRLPMVEDVGVTMISPLWGYAGDGVVNESGVRIFTVQWNIIDYNYLPVIGIELAEGRNVRSEEEILVNEEFVRAMGWTDGAIGKQVHSERRMFGTIVGVMKDFSFHGAYAPMQPVLFNADDTYQGQYTVRLKEPFDDNLRALNREMKEMFPQNDIVFRSLRKELDERYGSVRRFRDSVIIASLSIFLIALMGLFGYINEEIRRRSKEIAIRKVNGAEAKDILTLLSSNIFWTAFISVSLGAVAAYFIGQKWLEQFADKIHHTVWMYIGVIFVLNMIIHLGVMFKSWNIANENPVDSIKDE
ncbi:MAG: ABC transporter permease [Bacteroides sp.]|nr:ABC transporter permease [Bacteroides sp.]